MEFLRTAFKAYDIRGRVPDELNEDLVYRIGRAYVELLGARKVVVGRDVRPSSKGLAEALSQGLADSGCDVINIGLCGTEQVYFATVHLQTDGGIMVTASHNPMGYNGLKLVRHGARPISGDTGLRDIEELAVNGNYKCVSSKVKGTISRIDITEEYIRHLLTYVDIAQLLPLRLAVNAGNGCAGPIIDALEKYMPFTFIKVHHHPDGTFPNGVPNPLLPENRDVTGSAVRQHNADLGIAWDGDFDRCFFFDEKGTFIEGYYVVGLLAKAFLQKHPGAKIIHDPRLTWNTIEIIKDAGGIPIQSKTGHAFIKERMRQEDAVYGGEMSAHHYFRDFGYCDSGMIPWLLVVGILSGTGKSLSTLVSERQIKFPCSGEINCQVNDATLVMRKVEEKFLTSSGIIDRTDGLCIEYPTWRFSLRSSNTEPLIRLNVETRGDLALMYQKTDDLLKFIDALEK